MEGLRILADDPTPVLGVGERLVALEGYLALHFGGPSVAWSEYSREALRRGLTTVVQPTMGKGRRAGRLLLNPPRNGLPVVEVLDTEVFRGRTLGPPAG